jgi:hypothetical protein
VAQALEHARHERVHLPESITVDNVLTAEC